MKRVIASIAVILGSILCLPVFSVGAIEYGGVGGAPANPKPDNPRSSSIFIYTLKPGSSATDAVKIFNNTDKERTIEVHAVDSVIASGGSFSCAQRAEPRRSVGAWVSLATNSVIIAANSSAEVGFTITVPDGAGVGEHDGCITIQDMSETKKVSETSGVTLGFRSGIRMVVAVPGEIVKSLSLQRVDVSRLSSGEYQITPFAKNDGNVSLDTSVKVAMRPVLGIGTSYAEGTYPILPRSEASWHFVLKPPFWGGFYKADVTATYNGDTSLGLGQGGVDSSQDKTVERSSSVFFVPPSPLAILIELVILLALTVVATIVIKKRREISYVRRHWTDYTVKDGQTISEIAKLHRTTWKKIARNNRLKAPYTVKSGQKLKVPRRKST